MGYQGARLLNGRGIEILIDGRVLRFEAVDMVLVRDNDDLKAQVEAKYGRKLPINVAFTRDAFSNVTLEAGGVVRG